MIIHFSSP